MQKEDGFAIVGMIRLKVLIGESASDTLQWNESQIELGVVDDQSIAQGSKELCVPEGSAEAAENMPVGFCDVGYRLGICRWQIVWFDACVGKWVDGGEQISL